MITVAVAALVMAQASVALADNTTPDGDNTQPVAADPLAFGTVCINSTTNAGALVAISRNGSATGTNTFKDSAIVSVSVLSVSGSGLSATMGSPATITLPSNWSGLANNTMSNAVSSQVTLVAGSSPGSFSGSVTYRATGLNSNGATINRDATMAVAATVSNTGACTPTPPDTTPPTVNVSFPSPVSGQNGWFNAADVTPVVGTVTASDASNVTNISCSGATVGGVTGYGTNTASGAVTVSGDGTHNVTCTATDGASPANTGAAAGSSNTATIKIDTTAPTVTAALGRSPDSNGWYNHPVDVSATGTDNLSGGVSCDPTVTYSGPDSATASVKMTCTDAAGNPGSDTATFQYDSTGPTVTAALGRSPDSNGWYNHPVDVSATGTDNLSGGVSCDPTVTYSGPDSATASVKMTCTDAAGNPGSDTATFQYDATAPTGVATALARGPDHNGWYNQPVGWATTGTDATSGIASCSSGTYSGPDNGNQTVSGTCTDNAGNTSAPAASATFKYDATAPTLNPSVSPNPVLLNGSATASANAADNLSGVDSQSCDPVGTGTIGTHSVSCTATDIAGNSASGAASYSVIYRWDGFLQPINDTAHQIGENLSVFKAGSTVPVKLQLKDANGTPVQGPAAPQWLAPQKGSSMTAPVDENVYTDPASTGSSFTYDPTTQTYQFNWQTPKSGAGYWWKVSVQLPDGTIQTVIIGLR